MFGIIYSLLLSAGVVKNKIEEKIENDKCKVMYENSDGLTYTDSKGHSRLMSNNEMVFYGLDKNGDYVLENLSGNIIKNYSLEKRNNKLNKEKQLAIETTASTYCIDNDNHKNDWICQGKRFKDIKTGDIYVIRCIKHKYYYMDIKNGFLVRKTDWQIQKDKTEITHRLLNYDVDINEFNKNQKAISNKPHLLFRNFDYNTTYDYYK